MKRLTIAIAALALAFGGCSGGSEDAPTTEGATSAAPGSSTSAPSTTSQPTTTEAATTTTTTTTAAPAEGFAAVAESLGDVGTIDVAVEGTTRPRFTWTAESPLERVIVVVSAADGTVLWAWGGQGDTVTVGAGDVDRDGVGARLNEAGWVQVVGFDGDGSIAAISPLSPVG